MESLVRTGPAHLGLAQGRAVDERVEARGVDGIGAAQHNAAVFIEEQHGELAGGDVEAGADLIDLRLGQDGPG